MAREGIERSLTVILSADVVGYSRLMEIDEAGTLVTLKARRKELIEHKVAEFHGHVVKLMADGTLMVLGSVMGALVITVVSLSFWARADWGVAEQEGAP